MSEKIKKFNFTLKYALDIGNIELDFKTLEAAQFAGIIPYAFTSNKRGGISKNRIGTLD